MNKRFLVPLLLGLILSALNFCISAEHLKRADSYFGIHLDFHCNMGDQNVGANTTEQMVNDLIDLIRPDFIQIDCKGHPGVSSYPTKAGNPNPNIIGDPLRVWRKVTDERGVALYMHYSGVWDECALKNHPEWGIVRADGSYDDHCTSSFSTYTDDLMIPQLKELALDYKVDGVWVDGDCWAIAPDYCDDAKEQFRTETGIESIPQSKNDPYWNEWLEFHRNHFRARVRHWVDAVHQVSPQFQIASNWAYTDHMPEPVSSNVDFISGDYTPHESVAAARCSARFISSQGMPWDLMAWSFAKDENDAWKQKGAEQIKREAACVLSQGGGFQAYYGQNRDGSVDLEKIKPMKEVSEFCRARQPFCFRSVSVPESVLVIPTDSHYKRLSEENGGLFSNMVATWQRGLVSAVLDNQYSLDVMTDASWLKNPDSYPVTFISEITSLSDHLSSSLALYLQNGGALFVIGQQTVSLFNKLFDSSEWKTDPDYPALRIGTYGNGKVALLSEDVSNEYSQSQSQKIRDEIGAGMAYLYPDPGVTVNGSRNADISLRRLTDGRLSLHLVNTSGPHNTEHFVDSIDPIGPLAVSIKMDKEPKKVTLQPEDKELPFEWKEGRLLFNIEQIGIYDIVVFD